MIYDRKQGWSLHLSIKNLLILLNSKADGKCQWVVKCGRVNGKGGISLHLFSLSVILNLNLTN